jgi:chemotaxis protein methyltransferase CheR
MIVEPGWSDVERLRAAVARHLGLRFEDAQLGMLAEVLRRRVEAGGGETGAWLARLEAWPAREELRALAPELTVGETYFFRHMEQFRAFSELAVPERLGAGAHRLRVLSAGCSTGEEAYSLAILMRETLAAASWEVRAVDVNPAVLAKAALGRYSAWSLRETPPEVQRRWFRPDGRAFRLDERVRSAVTFEERNLTAEDAKLWPAESYDVVFCRNVLMYMTSQTAQAVVARIAGALAPGGYLFLGHAETLRGLSHDFHLRHTHGTFYYQRRDTVAAAADRPPATTAAWPGAAAPPLPLAVEAGSWVETIRRAAERIQALADRPAAAPPPRAARDLGIALDLLRQERFAEALAQVQSLPMESAPDADVALLRAVLLTHNGRLGEAEAACRELFARDELNAGAHYVLALCREGAEDRQGAIEHDQMATYLDPGFAMPRLHLGLQARRNGEREAARRELAQALPLLEREDASRLLLFGGGFGREALLALCRAELVACGGAPA